MTASSPSPADLPVTTDRSVHDAGDILALGRDINNLASLGTELLELLEAQNAHALPRADLLEQFGLGRAVVDDGFERWRLVENLEQRREKVGVGEKSDDRGLINGVGET